MAENDPLNVLITDLSDDASDHMYILALVFSVFLFLFPTSSASYPAEKIYNDYDDDDDNTKNINIKIDIDINTNRSLSTSRCSKNDYLP